MFLRGFTLSPSQSFGMSDVVAEFILTGTVEMTFFGCVLTMKFSSSSYDECSEY